MWKIWYSSVQLHKHAHNSIYIYIYIYIYKLTCGRSDIHPVRPCPEYLFDIQFPCVWSLFETCSLWSGCTAPQNDPATCACVHVYMYACMHVKMCMCIGHLVSWQYMHDYLLACMLTNKHKHLFVSMYAWFFLFWIAFLCTYIRVCAVWFF